MISLTVREIIAATGARLAAGDREREIVEISTDTRRISRGHIFLPLRGDTFDGHEFIDAALEKGAVGFLARAGHSAVAKWASKPDLIALEVDDTLEAFGRIAGRVCAKSGAKVVGITGSTGKTSTKDILSGLTAQTLATVASQSNNNNEVGVPLTLLRAEPGTEVVIVEMGMRGRGQIARLVRDARPDIGIITNIGLTHVELLGSQEGIALAKSELASAVPATGLMILNNDDPWTPFIRERTSATVTTFGFGADADFGARDIRFDAVANPTWRVIVRGEEGPEMHLNVPGRHNIVNALAAVAAASALGVPMSDISARLARITLTEMRLSVFETAGGVTVVDDTYNANPTSMAGALDTLARIKPGARHIAVLGKMAELGPVSTEEHERLGARAATLPVDLLVGIGDETGALVESATAAGLSTDAAKHFESKGAAMTWLREQVRSGDIVLVKGSRAAGLEEVVADLARGA